MLFLQKFAESIRRTDRIVWAILGGMLGVALAVVLSFVDMQTSIAIAAGLALNVAVIQLGESIRKDEIEGIISKFEIVRQNAVIRDNVERLIEYYTKVREYDYTLLMDRWEYISAEYLDKLARISDGHMEISYYEESVILDRLADSCKSSLKAVEVVELRDVSPIEWWTTNQGMAYLRKNHEIASRENAVVERIFVLDVGDEYVTIDEDMENTLEAIDWGKFSYELSRVERILRIQHEHGVHVYVGVSKYEVPRNIVGRYVIFDNRIVKVEMPEYGFEVASAIYVRDIDVRRYMRYFEETRLRTRKFDPGSSLKDLLEGNVGREVE